MVLRSSKRVSPFRLSRLIALAAITSVPLVAADAAAERGGSLPAFASPTHFASEEQPASQTAAACTLTYNGGPLVAKVEAVAVYWGTPSAYVTANAPGIIKSVVSGKYIDQLAEYNESTKIVRGSFVGAYSITPSITSKTLDNSQIGPELEKQINAGNLPQPSFDAKGNSNTIFVLFFAPGISITLKQGGQTAESCVQFCGFHFGWELGGKKPVRYAVVPNMAKGSGCAQGCGNGEAAGVGDTISHELAEAITDPDIWTSPVPNAGWYDVTNQGCGEIADICAPGSGPAGGGDGTVDGYTMQYLWSEKNQQCQLTDPNAAPQPGCASNADCAAPVPICDTTSKSCVACQANSDCKGNRPVCDPKLEVCNPCASNSDCAAPTPICVTNQAAGSSFGSCVACLQNSDCTNAAPVCESNACTGCKSDQDCTDSANPTCNTGSGACGPTPGSSSGSGNGDNGNGTTTTTTTGCSMSEGPASNALGFGGLLFGLAAFARRTKRSRARR